MKRNIIYNFKKINKLQNIILKFQKLQFYLISTLTSMIFIKYYNFYNLPKFLKFFIIYYNFYNLHNFLFFFINFLEN